MLDVQVDPDPANIKIKVTTAALLCRLKSPLRATELPAFQTTDNNANSRIKCILLFVREVRDHDF